MKLVEGVLESRRCVKVSHEEIDDTITIEVVECDRLIIGRSRTIPVHQGGWLFFFGRPLVERIRQAVIECDEEIEASKQPPSGPNKKLVDAAYAALYHSPGGDYPQGYQPPPLVRLTSTRRPAERGVHEGRQVQPPPLVGPPTDPPSE